MGRVEGMVALVTGASRGIGRAIAVELAREGADVAVNYWSSEARAREVIAEIEGLGRKALLVRADVSKVPDVQRMVKETAEHFGRLDVLVNNAGGGEYQDILDITESDWDAILDLHLKGPFFAAQAAVPYMRAQGRGKIINIGSESGYIGEPILIHYAAAKGGMLTLTKSLALALTPTITVNTVSPGPVATEALMAGPEYVDEVREQIPLKRWGQPIDVARTVVFVASSDGDSFTGQTFDPNCGRVMP